MNRESCIQTIELLRQLVLNIHGVIDVIDDRNCNDIINLLKGQDAVVHPEPSCVMTYITDCCCDLCGVQLIREDNFCRCCGKRIEWEGR